MIDRFLFAFQIHLCCLLGGFDLKLLRCSSQAFKYLIICSQDKWFIETVSESETIMLCFHFSFTTSSTQGFMLTLLLQSSCLQKYCILVNLKKIYIYLF